MPHRSTDLLDIAFADTGPRDGPVVLLIHGWPDDASTWNQVAAALNQAGLRTIVPTLRGFGETRLHDGAPRTGNSAILAIDMIALMDGLGVERFMVAGHDWGSNTAEAMAVGWPERVERLAMLATPPRLGGMPTPPFEQAQRQWYHWFMATERGAATVCSDRRDFAHIHWADVTLHSYRARWDKAAPDRPASGLRTRSKRRRRSRFRRFISRAPPTASIRHRPARMCLANSPAPSPTSNCQALAISCSARTRARSRGI